MTERMQRLAIILILITLLTPRVYAADIAAQAFIDARADAKKDVDPRHWLVWGCCTGVIGWSISYTSSPEIPVERIMGKSPEYVHFYMYEYERKIKDLQSHYAGIGSIVSTVTVALFSYFVLKESNPLNLELPW